MSSSLALLVVIDFVVAAVDADSFLRFIVIVVVFVVIDFIVFVVDTNFCFRTIIIVDVDRARWRRCAGVPLGAARATRRSGPGWAGPKSTPNGPGASGGPTPS